MNKLTYHFDDFTLEEYQKLILLAKSKYTFTDYTNNNSNEPFVYWRHDVDMSMESAFELAKIEHNLGVRAHYFVLPHSEFYNLLEKSTSNLVLDILNLGHSIQLHFDAAYHEVASTESLEQKLKLESDFFNQVFGIEITAFSFHNPSQFDLSCEQKSYADLANTYSAYFKKEVSYISDSNGYWRHKRFKELLENENHQKLQVLTHPEWWQADVMSPKQKVWKHIDDRAQRTKDYYNKLLSDNGRENIDW